MTQLLGGRYGAAQLAFVRADNNGKFEFWAPRWRDQGPTPNEYPVLWAYARTEDGSIAPSVSINLTGEFRDKTDIRGLELKVGAKANYSGRVVDGKGTPVPNTKITPTHLVFPSKPGEEMKTMRFTDELGALFSTVTDSHGKFTLTGLPESKTLFANIAAPNTLPQTVRWGTKTEPEIQLGAGGTIRGKITNMPAGDFAARVDLLIMSMSGQAIDQPQPQFSFTTKFPPKADGTFEIADVPPGNYDLLISPKESDRTIPQEFSIPVKCEAKSGQITENVQLALPGVITGHGRVVDEQSGAPIAGATIMFLKQHAYRSYIGSATTDAKGEYRAYFLPGKIVIEPGRAPNGYLPPADDLQSPAVEFTKDFEGPTFKYQKAMTFRGSVVNEEGRPVAGAEIRWIQPHRRGQGLQKPITSDESGQFEIPQVDPQDPLPIRVRSLQGVSVAVLLQPEEFADPKPILVSPKNAFRIKGTLTTQRGKPVGNATVAVHWHRRYVSKKTRVSGSSGEIEKVKTNEQGQFESSGFWDTDRYHIMIEADGFPRMDLREVAGEAGRTHDYGNVKLHGANITISGKVVDPGGKPIRQVTVYNSGDAADVIRTKTDDNGQFQLSGLLEGPVYLFAEQTKYRMTGIYTSDPSNQVVLTMIPVSAPPAPRSDLNLQSLETIRQRHANQLAEWIKNNNLAFRPSLPANRFNALARTNPDEALKELEKLSKAADQRSTIAIARSLIPEQPRKKDPGEKDAQAVKAALRFVERAASHIDDQSADRQIYQKASIGLMFLRLGDTDRGKPLVESAAKDFAESTPLVEHFAIPIAEALAWYDVPRALSYQDRVREQYSKNDVRRRVIIEVARYDIPRALELLNDPTLKKGMDVYDDGLRMDLAYRIGRVDPPAAMKLIDGMANFRTKAEASGWTAVAVAGANPALAKRLIDQAMETLQAHRTAGGQSFYYEWLPAVAANVAVQATEVDYPDIESVIQRVLSLRIPAHRGTTSVSRYQATVNSALYLAFIDPIVAKRLLADLEPEIDGKMLGNGGVESVGMNQWLCAWVVADPEHATVLLKAEMEKSRGSKEPPYWITQAYTLLSLPKAEQLKFVRENGNVDLARPYTD